MRDLSFTFSSLKIKHKCSTSYYHRTTMPIYVYGTLQVSSMNISLFILCNITAFFSYPKFSDQNGIPRVIRHFRDDTTFCLLHLTSSHSMAQQRCPCTTIDRSFLLVVKIKRVVHHAFCYYEVSQGNQTCFSTVQTPSLNNSDSPF